MQRLEVLNRGTARKRMAVTRLQPAVSNWLNCKTRSGNPRTCSEHSAGIHQVGMPAQKECTTKHWVALGARANQRYPEMLASILVMNRNRRPYNRCKSLIEGGSLGNTNTWSLENVRFTHWNQDSPKGSCKPSLSYDLHLRKPRSCMEAVDIDHCSM
jgi:hypothetical protein